MDLLQKTTPDIVIQAKAMLRTARYGALATLDPHSGAPLASRVGVSTDSDGALLLLISKLAAHTPALLADPRCSLLIGTLGKGDPLAHARISIQCIARELEPGSDDAERARGRYIAHSPKAKLYSSLGDFRFFRLEPQAASLNGGFGRAYALTASDLLIDSSEIPALAAAEPGILEHMNSDHMDAINLYARHFSHADDGNWRMVGIDIEGIEIADGEHMHRIVFEHPLISAQDARAALVKMAVDARRALFPSGENQD